VSCLQEGQTSGTEAPGYLLRFCDCLTEVSWKTVNDIKSAHLEQVVSPHSSCCFQLKGKYRYVESSRRRKLFFCDFYLQTPES